MSFFRQWKKRDFQFLIWLSNFLFLPLDVLFLPTLENLLYILPMQFDPRSLYLKRFYTK